MRCNIKALPPREGYNELMAGGGSTKREMLAAIGQVHWTVSFPLAISALASIVLSIIAAIEFSTVGKHAKTSSFTGLTTTLATAASLQALLLLLLVARGLVSALTRFFTFNVVQMIMVIHCFVPNLLITGLWVAHIMIDALVDQASNADHLKASNVHLKAAYGLHTAAMIFSNIYSAYSLSVIFANTAFFSSLKLEGAGRDAKEFVYYGAA